MSLLQHVQETTLSSFHSWTNTPSLPSVFAKVNVFLWRLYCLSLFLRSVDQSLVWSTDLRKKLVVFSISFMDWREGQVRVMASIYLKGFVKGSWEKWICLLQCWPLEHSVSPLKTVLAINRWVSGGAVVRMICWRYEAGRSRNRELERRLNRKFEESSPSGKPRTKFSHKVMMLIEM